MSRSRTHKNLENEKGLIKQLNAEIKRLKKQLRSQEKQLLHPIEVLDELLNEEIEVKRPCPKCQSNLVTSNLGIKWLDKCPSCEYRKTYPK
jgi:restriction endonuclease S subunit